MPTTELNSDCAASMSILVESYSVKQVAMHRHYYHLHNIQYVQHSDVFGHIITHFLLKYGLFVGQLRIPNQPV